MFAEYPGAIWAPSPNFTVGRNVAVSIIVIHITDGQPLASRCVERFQKVETRASAHFVIGQGGEVYQLVRIGDRAWHDSGRNGCSVGIEHCARTPGELGRNDAGLSLTEAQLDASAELVADRVDGVSGGVGNCVAGVAAEKTTGVTEHQSSLSCSSPEIQVSNAPPSV